MNTITILGYSERSIVVAGDTKPIKDILKGAGGKWNARLVHPVTSAPLMGWVFSRTKQSALELMLTGNNVKFDRVIPSNFNDKTAAHFIQDPAEIDADNFCQRNSI